MTQRLFALLLFLSFLVSAAENLCPNPSMEDAGGDGGGPAGWAMERGAPGGTWATDQAHTGERSLKVVGQAGATLGWVSPVIPVETGRQYVLALWARLQEVTGANGAFVALYHLDEKGERIGQSGMITLGGTGSIVATTDWTEHLTVSQFPPEVKGVRINLRLYGATGTAWFDDVTLTVNATRPLAAPRPLRRGLRCQESGRVAIVASAAGGVPAAALQAALRERGWEVAIVDPATVDPATDPRDLIVLGSLIDNTVADYLYRRSYALEDAGYPGPGGYVLRPLIDPLGTGTNILVVGSSDAAGMAAGVAALVERLGAAAAGAAPLDVPLTVQSTLTARLSGWIETGAVGYLTAGDMKAAAAYRESMLKKAALPDSRLFHADYALHLFFAREMMAWDLMESCGLFSDEERLVITQYLLKVARSAEGFGYPGMREGLYSRENHGTRAARAFYYAWRYFSKYHAESLDLEVRLWRRKLSGFWAACFASSRSFEDSLSQHALGGSLVNTLDIGFQEPEWSAEFFASGRARQMGERCIAICNNMGDTVLLGDTASGDYPGSVFAMLGYHFRDPRYVFMLAKRGRRGFSTDEPLRQFDLGLAPEPPADHVGLSIIPADDLYFKTGIDRHPGVTLEEAFDKLTLRQGFSPDDEYLMLDGIAGGSHSYDDANSIGEFSANGRRWLCEIDVFNGPTMSFHNAVTVARDGLGDPAVPQAAEVVTNATGDGWAYSATRLPQYNGVDWTRHLLWLPGRYTVVLDELLAETPGDYSFVLGWRSLGEPVLRPGLFESAQDERRRGGQVLTGEQLTAAVSAQSGKVLYHMAMYDALFYRADEVGDFVEMPIEIAADGRYDIGLRTLSYHGRGMIQASLDGQPLGPVIDQFAEGTPRLVDTALGSHDLKAGRRALRFTVTGRNPASDGYTFAVGEIVLHRAGETAVPVVVPNRFRLVFPPEVPTTLDRDRETLGQYLPTSPHYEPVLNIVEQTCNRRLEAGEAACFQNLFHAGRGEDRHTVELRRLDDHCALIRTGDRIELFAASVGGLSRRLGDLEVAGRLALIGADRRLLHDATASLAGRALTAGTDHDAALAKALAAAWEAAAPGTAAAAGPSWPGPVLGPRWTMDLTARPLAVTAFAPPQGGRIVIGHEDGLVRRLDLAGAADGEFRTDGPVQALLGCDLDGQPGEELLVGSDDERLYARGHDLAEIWTYRVPFLRDEQPWLWWTLGKAKVRRLHAADLDGDGRPEILAGCGNMRLHCIDTAGKELWRFRTDHGICTTLTSADVFGEGRTRLLAGNGLTSSAGSCWVLDERGKTLQRYYNGSWCTALPAIAVGDLDGDGKQTVFCGNNRGDVRAYAAVTTPVQPLWIRNMTRPIRSLTVLPRPGGAVLAVGSDSGTLCAFDESGALAWRLPLSSAITHTALLRRGDGVLLAAGCKDGRVFLVTPSGEMAGQAARPGRLQDLAVVRNAADGTRSDAVVVVSADPNEVWMLAAP